MATSNKTEFHKERRDPQIHWYNTTDGKRWRTKFRITKNGKRLSIEKRGFRSFEEARLAKAAILTDIDTDVSADTRQQARMTFDEYWRRFTKRKVSTGKWRESTLRSMTINYRNHIMERWGDIPINKITRLAVQEWVSQMNVDNHYKINTINLIVRQFGAVMEDAYVNDIIQKNPVKKIEVSGRDSRDTSMTREQYEKVIDYIFYDVELEPTSRAALALTIQGLRRGESVALRLKDYQDGYITVVGQLTSSGTYTDTKTLSSHRTIPLVPAVDKLVQEAIAETRAFHLRHGRIMGQDDFILHGRDRVYYNPGNLSKLFAKMSEKLGFEMWPHKMRHAFSTFAFDIPGINPKDIMRVLGHTSLDMSMMYNNGTEEGRKKVVNAFGNDLVNNVREVTHESAHFTQSSRL